MIEQEWREEEIRRAEYALMYLIKDWEKDLNNKLGDSPTYSDVRYETDTYKYLISEYEKDFKAGYVVYYTL